MAGGPKAQSGGAFPIHSFWGGRGAGAKGISLSGQAPFLDVAQGRIGKSSRAKIVGFGTRGESGGLCFVTWNSWDMPALIRLPNIARLLVMNTAYSMTSFGTILENTKGNKASSRYTKASFSILNN